jgi:hypothetical protein
MKHIAGILALLLLAALCGCGADMPTDIGAAGPEMAEGQAVPFAAHFLQTGLRGDTEDDGAAAVIRSLDALYQYYNDNRFAYVLSGGFADIAGVYDTAFFDDNALVVTTLREPSVSIGHRVTGVWMWDDTLQVEISRLVPEVQDDEEAFWHILVEAPQSCVEGRNVDAVVRDDTVDVCDIPPYSETTLWSAGCSVTMYEAVVTEVVYDDNGDAQATSHDQDLRTHIADFPTLTVGDALLENGWLALRGDITLWDADFEVLDTPETLTAAMLYERGAGTYYLGLGRTRNTAYVPAADAYNHNASVFLAKLIVPECPCGMAEQWAGLGGFDWADVTDASVSTRTDGHTATTRADDGGIARLVALLCTTPQANTVTFGGNVRWAQIITLSDKDGDAACVYWSGSYLYLNTGGVLYSVDAPPWLFGELVQAALGQRLISQPEAEAYAVHVMQTRPEKTGGTYDIVSAQLNDDGCWDVLCDTANGRVCVCIAGDTLERVAYQ